MPKITYESMGYSEHLKARESMKNLGAELEQISEKDRLNVNMHDPRANSNNCLFDLFVMANHDIAFKDIRAFQKNELQGHDKAKYFEEFKKFVETSPLHTVDEFGRTINHPENAKKWGEMLHKANQKISEYKLPDCNLFNPREYGKYNDEVTYLSKIGTDYVQVEEKLINALKDPDLAHGFVEGFGSVKNMNQFHTNIYTLQGIMNLTFKPDGNITPEKNASFFALYKYTSEKMRPVYAGKTVKEFNQAYSKADSLTIMKSSPFAMQPIESFSPEDQKAIQDYLEKDVPLPKNITDQIDEIFHAANDEVYPSSIGFNVEQEFGNPGKLKTLEESIKPLLNAETLPEVKDMTPEQKKAALDGFDSTFTPAYTFSFTVVNQSSIGKDPFDLIKIGDQSAKEFSAEKYKNDKIFGENTKFEELSDSQKEEYMKLNIMRAVADPSTEVKCHDLELDGQGKLVETKVKFSSKKVHDDLKKEPEYVAKNRQRVQDAKNLSNELVNLVNEVDFNLLGQGSQAFKDMKKEVAALKKFTDQKFNLDSKNKIPLNSSEALLDAQYKALTRIKDYLEYKQEQFNREPNRRNDPKRQVREQPRIKNSLKMFDKLQTSYLANKKYVMERENELRTYLGKKLDEAEKERKDPDASYPSSIKKSVDLIFKLDGKRWEGKEDGKAVEHFKKLSEGLKLNYTADDISEIGLNKEHPGYEIIQKALKDEMPHYENGKHGQKILIEEKKYSNKELISMAVKDKGVKTKVNWPEVKSLESHKIELHDFRTDLWSQQTKESLNHKEMYNDQDKALVQAKQAGVKQNDIPKGPVIGG